MSPSPIQNATLSWNAQGTPISQLFDDVYFSNQDGLAETRYVFLQGNGLPDRWRESKGSELTRFTIAETGFGTGLNFLTLWQAYDGLRQQACGNCLPQLHFISVEKYPLRREDLQTAHAQWPELTPFSEQLCAVWPSALPGCHRLCLDDGRITLDLWFGDVQQLIYLLPDSLINRVDAWFLDGFAPSKNPDMWNQPLFDTMVKLTKPQGTFATFTAAGFVRRGLQQAGFKVQKINGFGHKREMLVGKKPFSTPATTQAPWFHRPAANHPHDVAIIGGGIASVFSALALMARGSKVTLYCADERAAKGASGNRQGALYPLLNGRNDTLERFFISAFPFALRQYQTLMGKGICADHAWCGVTQLGWNEKSARKIAKIIAAQWPAWLVESGDAAKLSQRTGVPLPHSGITYALGGWLNSAQFTHSALQYAAQQGLQIHYQHALTALQHTAQGWHLHFANGQQRTHACVVLANGHQLNQFPQTAHLPLYAVRGQVSHIPTSATLSRLKQVLCYDGYLTPLNSHNQQHCIGASYQRNQQDTAYSPHDQRENRQRLLDCLAGENWPQEVDISGEEARVGVRCAIRDHLPMVGAVPDFQATLQHYHHLLHNQQQPATLPQAPCYPDLFMLGGLGSRGLCSAPLCGEILAGQIYGEALPVEQDVLDALNPNRLWVRKLLKGRPV